MRLQEYENICAKLGHLYEDIEDALDGWRSTDWARIIEGVTAIETELSSESKAGGVQLAESCRVLVAWYKHHNTRRAFTTRVEGCKQYLTKHTKISYILGPLKEGMGDLSEDSRKALISALNGVQKHCAKLSGICLRVLSQKELPTPTVPQAIEGSKEALELAKDLQVGGCLDEEYRPTIKTKSHWAVMGQKLAELTRCDQDIFGNYWGLKPGRIRKDAPKATLNCKVHEIIRKYERRKAGLT